MRDINDVDKGTNHHICELKPAKRNMGSDKSRHRSLSKVYMKVRGRRDTENPVLVHASKICLN